MDKSSSNKAHKETSLEERMSHHHLHEGQSLSELHKEYRKVHDDSKRLQHKVEQSQAHQVHLNESHSDIESAEWEARAKMDQNMEYTKDLQQQQKDCQFEGTLIEKEIQKGMVKNVAEALGREFHMHQVVIDGEQRENKQEQKEIVIEEERQRGVYNLATDNRDAAIVAEREKKILERGNQSKILGDILVADGVARQVRDDKITLIHEKEMFEKRADQDDSERERLEHSLEEIEKSNISQRQYKQRAAVEMQKEENRFRVESEKLMALQDEMQLETDRLKMERNHQYSLDLQAQIADNSRRRLAEEKSEQIWAQNRFDSNQEWRSHEREDGRMLHFEEFEVPQAVSDLGSDVAKYDDNVRQNETQQALEENIEDENERKKEERNHQYSLDLQAQIADNARRRQAEKEYEQGEYERNEQWRDKATAERKKVFEERNVNVGWDEERVVRRRTAPEGDHNHQH